MDDRDQQVDCKQAEEAFPAHHQQRGDVVLRHVLLLPAHLTADDDLRENDDGIAERRVGRAGVRRAALCAHRRWDVGRRADHDGADHNHPDAEPLVDLLLALEHELREDGGDHDDEPAQNLKRAGVRHRQPDIHHARGGHIAHARDREVERVEVRHRLAAPRAPQPDVHHAT